MSTYEHRWRRRIPGPAAGGPALPVDQEKIGRSSVRRRARGMTHTEAAAALEEAELDRHLDRRHEEAADDGGRGEATLKEWRRIVQLLAATGAPYDPDADAAVQDEKAADIEAARRRELAAEQHRQEQEAEAARQAALAPDVLRHALLRTLTRTRLLDGLSEDEQAVIERLPHTDPAAALAVNVLLARAYDVGADSVSTGAGRE